LKRHWVLLLPLLLGCGKSAAKQEAERIVAAIERVQLASPEGRKAQVEALEAERAEGELAERARARCAASYRGMVDAREKLDAVKKKMADHERAGTTPEGQLMIELVRAQDALDAADKAMPECQTALRELRQTLR
jgi:hypothetical protein